MTRSLNNPCRIVPQKQFQVEMIRGIVKNTFQLLFSNTGILRRTCKAACATCKWKQHKVGCNFPYLSLKPPRMFSNNSIYPVGKVFELSTGVTDMWAVCLNALIYLWSESC